MDYYNIVIFQPCQVKENTPVLNAKISGLNREGQGLLIEKALLDAGDILTPYTHQSGSIIFLVKLNPVTDEEAMNTESEVVHLLNSRNARLVTIELGGSSLERTTLLTDGFYYSCTDSYCQGLIMNAMDQVVTMVKQTKFQSRRVQLIQLCRAQ